MGTLAAGIKEIFATAKTNGSNVMLCGNDGTPDGHMTMANLASVLGGISQGQINDSVDFDDIKSPGLYFVAVGFRSNPNYPIANGVTAYGYGTLIVTNATNSMVQIYIPDQSQGSSEDSNIFYREIWDNSKNVGWSMIVRNIPTFYKDYNNLSSLANALGVDITSVGNYWTNDYDPSALPSSYYTNSKNRIKIQNLYGGSALGAPTDNGIVITLNIGTSAYQIIIRLGSSDIFIRNSGGGSSWSSWSKITPTVVS